MSSGTVYPMLNAPVCESVSTLETDSPSTSKWITDDEGTPPSNRSCPKSSTKVPLT